MEVILLIIHGMEIPLVLFLYLSTRLKKIISIGGEALHTSMKSKIEGYIASALEELQTKSTQAKMEHEGITCSTCIAPSVSVYSFNAD